MDDLDTALRLLVRIPPVNLPYPIRARESPEHGNLIDNSHTTSFGLTAGDGRCSKSPTAGEVNVTHHVLHDIGKESTAVFADRVIGDDSFDSIGTLVPVLAVELLSELPILACVSASVPDQGR